MYQPFLIKAKITENGITLYFKYKMIIINHGQLSK